MFLIYKITNIQNKKIYIGQTKDLEKRKQYHYNCAYYYNKSWLICRAFRKYGWHNFQWEILGYSEIREEINEIEKECIWFYQSNNNRYGYNLTNGGDGGNTYISFDNDKKQKIYAQIVDTNRRNKTGFFNEGTRKKSKISNIKRMKENNPNKKGKDSNWFGRKHKKESIEKRLVTLEKNKNSFLHKGRKLDEKLLIDLYFENLSLKQILEEYNIAKLTDINHIVSFQKLYKLFKFPSISRKNKIIRQQFIEDYKNLKYLFLLLV